MNVDSKVLLCKDTLECETIDNFYACSCYDIKCDECPLSEVCNSEHLEFIKLRARRYLYRMEELDKDMEELDKNMEEVKRIAEGTKTQPWTKETVFKVYCRDNLYELPLKILEQMRDHLDNIIDSKTPLE